MSDPGYGGFSRLITNLQFRNYITTFFYIHPDKEKNKKYKEILQSSSSLQMKIHFIQTGGTIDKDYPKKIAGSGFEIGSPAVTRILDSLETHFQYVIVPLLQKDSLDLDDTDRELILNTVIECPSEKIIITHGTDSIIETGMFLQNAQIPKTIVLTGSFKPERFTGSDAMFNVGAALACVQILPHGVYIALQGLVEKADGITRNRISGKFISKDKNEL